MQDVTMPSIVSVIPSDFKRWAEHLNRQTAQQGRDGRPFFTPMDGVDYGAPEFQTRFEASLVMPLDQPGWKRMWAVQDAESRFVAHLDLMGSRILSELHRATLGIGVEEDFHRQGLGRRLMQQAIEFARVNHIDWLDLYVFSENHKAIELYRSLGFKEIGRCADRFRLGGLSIDDVTMTLEIGALAAA